MKIEKINEYSLRFTLTKEDLEDRDVTIKDLVTDSTKTQDFIRELMFQALDEFEFDTMDKPLIVEASPNMNEGIVITISKMDRQEDETKTANKIKSLMPSALGEKRFITEDIDDYEEFESFSEDDDDSRISTDNYKRNNSSNSKSKRTEKSNHKSFVSDSRLAIYSFSDINQLCFACERLTDIFSGKSSVYKYENKFYMILNNSNSNDRILLSDIEPILSEYGIHNRSNAMSKYFLEEHGEVIIAQDAVKKAALL